jgi:NAD(P)-dependent dehydrogenase (short-subunit alcohol dehydrogenase family)
MHSFQDDVIMISGGSKGIGFAAAARLGARGSKISFCARDEADLQQVEKTLCDAGIDVLAVRADVSADADVERWFEETERRFGSLTILVNNAGISGVGPFTKLSEEQWDKTMSVNCRGVFLCTRRALPAMMQAQKGRIFMISSVSSKYYRKGHSLYFATKWALNGFAHCLAKEVREYGIHVHILCPGMTETRFFDNMGGRPHSVDKIYADPEIYAEQMEALCHLPDHMDTLEFCTFPSWQLNNFGIRR